MRIRKRYEEFSINETFEDNKRRERTVNAIAIILIPVDIALLAVPIYLSCVKARECAVSLTGAFIFAFGIAFFSKSRSKIFSFVLMAYGIFVFVINIIYPYSQSVPESVSRISRVIVAVSFIISIISDLKRNSSKNNSQKTYLGTGVYFLTDLKNKYNKHI